MVNMQKVDQAGLRTGQLTTILLLLFAFVIGRGAWGVVAFVALAQLLGALAVPFAPYRLFYTGLQRNGLLKPNPQPDNPEPHRFAMLVGAIFNGVGAMALLLGGYILGWTLVWIVISLANLNYWANFCMGCWMYYQLNRLGVPGFVAQPVQQK